jgi:hypothetical protein
LTATSAGTSTAIYRATFNQNERNIIRKILSLRCDEESSVIQKKFICSKWSVCEKSLLSRQNKRGIDLSITLEKEKIMVMNNEKAPRVGQIVKYKRYQMLFGRVTSVQGCICYVQEVTDIQNKSDSHSWINSRLESDSFIWKHSDGTLNSLFYWENAKPNEGKTDARLTAAEAAQKLNKLTAQKPAQEADNRKEHEGNQLTPKEHEAAYNASVVIYEQSGTTEDLSKMLIAFYKWRDASNLFNAPPYGEAEKEL